MSTTTLPTDPGPTSARAGPLDTVYHVFQALGLLLLGLLLVWRPLSGFLDFWAHAAVGRWCWQSGEVPHRTLFLWTADEEWVYHHWLSQVVFYGLTNVAGDEGLPHVVLAFTMVLALLPFALAWLVWRWSGRLSSLLVFPFALAMEGVAPRLQTRPELFTEVFLCVLLLFLLAWSRSPGDVRRWDRIGAAALLVGFVLWANLHGAVMLGLQVLAVTAVCDLVQDRCNTKSRLLTGLALLAPLAVCVNPYGLNYWRAFSAAGTSNFAQIAEWLPVWKEPVLPPEMITAVAVLAPLALLAWALNPGRRLAHLGWLLLLGGSFVAARRNIWPFLLTCLMILAANARSIDPQHLWERLSRWSGKETSPPPLVRWPLRIGFLAWVALECLTVAMGLAERRGQSLTPVRLEQGIVQFIHEHELTGRVFNDYENSSYLQWRLAGCPDLYIDLLNAYPAEVMADYHAIRGVTARGRQLLDEQQIEIVVLTTNRGPAPSLAPLADYLDANQRWARVYAGKDGALWVRRTPPYERVWGRLNRSVNKVAFATLERYGHEHLEYVAGFAPQ
jgi:hypothetical protein